MAASDLESDRAPERDWFLALLVDHVNEHEGEIPITVTVSGCVVSGMLVGVREYYERSVDELANIFPTRVEAITEALTAAGEQSVDSVRRHKAQVRAGEAELETPHYIHLRDVEYLNARSSSAHAQGSLWRARLESVAGFSLGRP